MPTRSGAQYTPRTTRRVQARMQAAARTRSRTTSVPARLSRSRQLADLPSEISIPIFFPGAMPPEVPTESSIPTSQGLRVISQATPVTTPPFTGSSPGAPAHVASGIGENERIDARTIRNICVEEDLAREREIKKSFYREIQTLRDEIRALKARDDQSETVIADIQTLRRDVISLLERSAVQLLAREQSRRHHGADPAPPITVEDAPAPRRLETHPRRTAEEPDQSSFSRLSELLARPARLETSKRDGPDHPMGGVENTAKTFRVKTVTKDEKVPTATLLTTEAPVAVVMAHLQMTRLATTITDIACREDLPTREATSAPRVSAIEASSPWWPPIPGLGRF